MTNKSNNLLLAIENDINLYSRKSKELYNIIKQYEPLIKLNPVIVFNINSVSDLKVINQLDLYEKYRVIYLKVRTQFCILRNIHAELIENVKN